MDQPSAPAINGVQQPDGNSQASEQSQTAQDYIASQLSLEADAREALPYQFDTCTKPLGPLRQSVYACLTCTPPPASPHQQFTPAGVCYGCSISCHGEHNLVELFSRRDFECDCGTTRMGNSSTPCALRHNPVTGRKGGVVGEEARQGNKYNQNFKGKFCGCGEEYDPEMEKGTMFQCLGLGTVEEGGCGEDWWHPECLLGLSRPRDVEKAIAEAPAPKKEVRINGLDDLPKPDPPTEDDHSPPDGFPSEDDFDHLICYKCVNAFTWIRPYAGSEGFLTAGVCGQINSHTREITTVFIGGPSSTDTSELLDNRKRKAEDNLEESHESKKAKSDPSTSTDPSESNTKEKSKPKHATLPPPPYKKFITTLFLKEDFRDHLCRCAQCFPLLAKHKQLLEEEDTYEPPLSESEGGNDDDGNGSVAGRSVNSGSLLDRGEAALSSIDRVRAIEGVMAYNHVKDKVKAFLQPFAESGQPVGAEDIKAYFAKLRGDEQAMREAAVGAEGGGGEADHRREQGGY